MCTQSQGYYQEQVRAEDYQQKQLEEERLAYQLFLLAWVDKRCSRVTSEALASELGIRDEFLKHIGASK